MKILIGILYCIENELQQCIASLKTQTHQDFDYFVLENLPKKEAHTRLYQTFTDSADQYQLFIKLDADMVLARNTYLEEVVREFTNDPELTLLQVAVHDFFTDQLIFGLHNYRNTVRWNPRGELFTDKQTSFKKTINDSHKLAPAAYHCPNPSPFQAFHFGVHKAVKVMQVGIQDKNINARNIHWDNIQRTKLNYYRTKKTQLGYAVLGAEIAFKYQFTYEQVDYNNLKLIEYFDKVKSFSPQQMQHTVRHYTIFRMLPPPFRLTLISLLAEQKNVFQIHGATYFQTLKNMLKRLVENDSEEVQ